MNKTTKSSFIYHNFILAVIILLLILWILITILLNIRSKNLCIISTPSACTYFCPDIGKNVTDFNVNADRILAYVKDYKCEVKSCDDSLRYEVRSCDLEKYELVSKYIVDKYKIKAEKTNF